MLQQFLKIAGVRNEKEFLDKYPTEESFFRQHPEALRLLEQSTAVFMPSYGDMAMPQAMYGMGMAYGGSYLPKAQSGGVPAPPKQEDYPDYESFNAAQQQYMTSLQQQADNPSPAAIQAQNQAMAADPASPKSFGPTEVAASVTTPVTATKLNPYQGISIVDFLIAQGKPSDFASRKQLAASLGIANYRGTASQNSQMLQMLQAAPDALQSYQGVTQPTANVTKRAAARKNAAAAPTTEQLAAAKLNATSGSLFFNNDEFKNYKVRRDISTGLFVAVVPPEGIMSPEYGDRKKLANRLNAEESMKRSGQPMIGPARGYEHGGNYPWTTWSGNQGFDMGGSYVPDYTSNVFTLPKFGLGSNMYQDGGMTQPQGQFDQQQLIQAIFQMIQQGMPPEQILQQLVQSGVPQEMAQQLIMMVAQQVQSGGGMEGGQEGMGGGQPNGFNPAMQAAAPQEQGMEGMPAMAYGGLPKAQHGMGPEHYDAYLKQGYKPEEARKAAMADSASNWRNGNPMAIGLEKFIKNSMTGDEAIKSTSEAIRKMMMESRMKREREDRYRRNLDMLNKVNPYFQMSPQGRLEFNRPGMFADGGTSYAPGQEMEVDEAGLEELRRNGINFEIID